MENINKQDKLRKFVSNEIFSNCSYLISELASNEKYMDELMEVCVQYEITWLVRDEKQEIVAEFETEEEAEEFLEDKEGFEIEENEETHEALEHWIVSDWLGDKLESQGEMVISFNGLRIWGRTCSGQAILLDGVIERIYDNLG